MENRTVTQALREMLREQLCCVGRVAARHQLPDDAVWDVVKGFEVIYRRACQQVERSAGGSGGDSSPRRGGPHPGLAGLLDRLRREEAVAAPDEAGSLAGVGGEPTCG
ncbi:MAG: hypothetical protein ISS78_07805 [Phycisphaerae bacterium]|nr:hypothetical protein [Phycisphaerae bacterium]